MKKTLVLKKALNHGWILTPDEGNGSYVAADDEQLGHLLNDEWRELEPGTPLFLSTVNPAHPTRREVEAPATGDAVVTIYDGGEDFKGVRVQALGEDFVVGLHDAENGKSNFSYDSAMEWLKEHGQQTFNRKQAAIICIYMHDINKMLMQAGGDPFAKDWYITNELYYPEGRSCADYNAYDTWYFNGSNGCFRDYYRCYGCFRCRPSIDLPLTN